MQERKVMDEGKKQRAAYNLTDGWWDVILHHQRTGAWIETGNVLTSEEKRLVALVRTLPRGVEPYRNFQGEKK